MKRFAMLFALAILFSTVAYPGVKVKIVETWVFQGNTLAIHNYNEMYMVIDKNVTVYSQITQQYSVISTLKDTPNLVKTLCLDTEGTRCYVSIATTNKGFFLSIEYSDIKVLYRYTFDN